MIVSGLFFIVVLIALRIFYLNHCLCDCGFRKNPFELYCRSCDNLERACYEIERDKKDAENTQ